VFVPASYKISVCFQDEAKLVGSADNFNNAVMQIYQASRSPASGPAAKAAAKDETAGA
jgi:hypothetical protein